MIAGIIQCRTGSKRLPRKALMRLGRKPMIQNVIDRVTRATSLDKVILATTELREDKILCDIAKSSGIEVFRGSENDLVDRYYQCAKEYNVDVIVRICADNPLIEPEEIDRIVKHYIDSSNSPGFDSNALYSNTHNIDYSGYPDGLGAEVYGFPLLKWIQHHYFVPGHREHPHEYFADSTKVINTVKCPKKMSYPNIKLDVNNIDEYNYVNDIYDSFWNNSFHFLDYVEDIKNGNCSVQCD